MQPWILRSRVTGNCPDCGNDIKGMRLYFVPSKGLHCYCSCDALIKLDASNVDLCILTDIFNIYGKKIEVINR